MATLLVTVKYINKSDGLRRQTVDRYTSTRKVHFQNMSVTLSFELMTFENVISVIRLWLYIMLTNFYYMIMDAGAKA